METRKCQVFVLGAGAGGTGAAYRLAKNGIHTIVADRNPDYGGTAVFAGVNCWEPGVSGPGMHRDIVRELERIPGASGTAVSAPRHLVYSLDEYSWQQIGEEEEIPFQDLQIGLSVVDPGLSYEQSLGRCRLLQEYYGGMKRYQFEPDAMRAAIHRVLNGAGPVPETLFGSELLDCESSGGVIHSVILSGREGEIRVCADQYIDASGDLVLAEKCGCDMETGSAPNGVSYLFRVRKTAAPSYRDTLLDLDSKSVGTPKSDEALMSGRIPLPDRDLEQRADIGDWVRSHLDEYHISACFNVYPNLDMNVNILPVLTGREYLEFGGRADSIGRARARAYWNFMQHEKGLNGWRILSEFPMAGVRETRRLKGRYILTEQDLRAGFCAQERRDEIIAYSDHAIDVHGDNGRCSELEFPYGIPFSCLLPKETENLLTACRGSSFDSTAASSCRLTRTMLSIGEAAGEAAAQRVREKKEDIGKIRRTLRCGEYEAWLTGIMEKLKFSG